MNIGIIGTGTVGGGVIKILQNLKNKSVNITKVCVRSLEKAKTLNLSSETEIVTDISDILEDENIDCVVELIGGVTTAWDIVKKSLENKKHVVTANKALIAKFMPEIEDILAQNPELFFGFEASVAGGIPIIHSLQKDFISDNIIKIAGILNGTTNFMLSKMMLDGASYNTVLKEAQDLGFAEADPTADVGGFDARAKLSILSRLAFGIKIAEEKIPTKGIEQISQDDFKYATLLQSSIKLLAVAQKNKDDSISAFVSPVVVPLKNPIGQVNGATNIVEIESEYLQHTHLVGQGAGRFPTANAVVSDILSIEEKEKQISFLPSQNINFSKNYESSFFVRFKIQDGLGIIRRISEVCENNNISIDSILQLPITNPKDLTFVLTTDKTSYSQVKKMVETIEEMDFVLEKPFYIPLFK